MASIVAIRDGLATRAGTITGLRAVSYVPDKISPPCFIVGTVEITYDETFQRGVDRFMVKCRLLVGKANDRSAQDKLDGYLAGSGASSIKTAIEGDRTLTGACSSLRVESVDGYGVYEYAGIEYLGADLSVLVIAPGS